MVRWLKNVNRDASRAIDLCQRVPLPEVLIEFPPHQHRLLEFSILFPLSGHEDSKYTIPINTTPPDHFDLESYDSKSLPHDRNDAQIILLPNMTNPNNSVLYSSKTLNRFPFSNTVTSKRSLLVTIMIPDYFALKIDDLYPFHPRQYNVPNHFVFLRQSSTAFGGITPNVFALF